MDNLTSKFNITTKIVPPFWIASKRIVVPSLKNMPKCLNQAYDDLFNIIHLYNIQINFCTAMICHSNPEKLFDIELEAALLIKSPLKNTDEISFYKMPETFVVSGVYVGDFSHFNEIHIAINKWIKDKGYVINGSYREFYYKHELSNLKDTITEIQFPIRTS